MHDHMLVEVVETDEQEDNINLDKEVIDFVEEEDELRFACLERGNEDG